MVSNQMLIKVYINSVLRQYVSTVTEITVDNGSSFSCAIFFGFKLKN